VSIEDPRDQYDVTDCVRLGQHRYLKPMCEMRPWVSVAGLSGRDGPPDSNLSLEYAPVPMTAAMISL